MFYQLPKIDNVKFDTKYNKTSYVSLHYGNFFHYNNAFLNELIQIIYNLGSDVFIHKNKEIITKNNINKFNDIIKSIKDKNLKEYLDIKENFKLAGKWEFRNYCNDGIFRNQIEVKKVNISSQIYNPTYIYSNDLLEKNILSIFETIHNKNINNILIKFPTIVSNVSFDYLKLLSYICDKVYVFKNDCNIKDSFYILGLSINKDRNEQFIKHIGSILKGTKNTKITRLLKLDTDNQDFINIFRKINNDICKVVNDCIIELF